MRIASAALLTAALISRAEAADIEALSHIDTVIVFPSGAEVTRVAKLKIDKGEHTLVFRDLPAGAVQNSIRVEGRATGKLEISSVDTRKQFVPRVDEEAAVSERKHLEDEIDRLRDQKTILHAQVQAAETQKSLIANLAQLPTRPAPPAEGGAPREDWSAILALIGSASADAERAALDARVKIRDLDHNLEDAKKKLSELAPRRDERTEVKVFVDAETPIDADVTVRYQVRDAMWTPLYDARLSTGTKTVAPRLDLTRRASILQRTGETWDNVAISLSTTRPTAGASVPELSPLTVDFEPETPPPQPVAVGRVDQDRLAAEDAAAAAPAPEPEQNMKKLARGLAAPQKAALTERRAEIVNAPFQAIYAVPGRLTVPETGEAKRVQLLSETMEPQISVRTVPREDAKAYLYVKLVLPKSSPLLPGSVSLFRDGTFIGEGRLPVLSPGEEFDLGFGVDDLVRVRHAVSEDQRGETGLITTSRTDIRNYRITVKNMHERAVGLTIFDRIPVSQNEQIKVDLNGRTAPSKENVDDKRGVLAWESKLEPDQEQVLEFGYKVTWPSGKRIVYGR